MSYLQALTTACYLLVLFVGAMGGLTTPAVGKTLKIGVPKDSAYPEFVTVKCDYTSNSTCFSGYSIDVFRLVWGNVYSHSDYQFIPYAGNYEDMVMDVYNKKLDAVVGDTSVFAARLEHIEYSRPYTETGARMVVLAEHQHGYDWIVAKPFTVKLWVLTLAVFLYNGLIVWFIETVSSSSEKGYTFSNISSLFWISFTPLFPINGRKLRSHLSRMAMVAWLFVALVLMQSYTASLTSLLTVQRLRPKVANMEALARGKEKVGCDKGKYMSTYLRSMSFGPTCVQQYRSDEYAPALLNGSIRAAFLEIPSIRLFLNKNPKGFVAAGKTYEVGGFAFVFQKGSHLVGPVSDQILRLRENGTLKRLEDQLLPPESRPSSIEPEDDDEQESLGPDRFWGFFVITGGASTLALVIFVAGKFHEHCHYSRVYPKIRSSGHSFRLILIRLKMTYQNHDEPTPPCIPVQLVRNCRRCNSV